MNKSLLLLMLLRPTFIIAQTNISNNPNVIEKNMDSHGGYSAVWEGMVDGVQRIFLSVESKPQALPSTSVYDQSPKIFGDSYVVWEGFDGNDTEINFYNGAVTKKLTNNNIPDLSPRIFEKNIAWYGGEGTAENDYEIYFYDGTTVVQLTNNSNNDINPNLYYSEVVWQGFDGHDYEIFLYSDGSVQQLTFNNEDDINPQVELGKVVWLHHDGNDFEIMFYNKDENTTKQVTNNVVDDMPPFISWGRIGWTAMDGDDYDIFYYDGTTITNITNNDVHDEFLGFNGSLKWIGYYDEDGEIFDSGFLPAIDVTDVNYEPDQLTYNVKEYAGKGHPKYFVWLPQDFNKRNDDLEIYEIDMSGPGVIKLIDPINTYFCKRRKLCFEF